MLSCSLPLLLLCDEGECGDGSCEEGVDDPADPPLPELWGPGMPLMVGYVCRRRKKMGIGNCLVSPWFHKLVEEVCDSIFSGSGSINFFFFNHKKQQ